MKRYIKSIFESLFDNSEDIINSPIDIDVDTKITNSLKSKILKHHALSTKEYDMLYGGNPDDRIKIPVNNVNDLVNVMIGIILVGEWLDFNCIDTSRVTSLSHFISKLKVAALSVNKLRNAPYDEDINHVIRYMDVSEWDVSNVTDMSYAFEDSPMRRGNGLDNWDVSNVKNMDYMFAGSKSFCNNGYDSDLANWDVSNVESMEGMFSDCELFDGNIGNWDVSNVKNMQQMFFGCEEFDQDLNGWNVDINKVTKRMYMFEGSAMKREHVKTWNLEPEDYSYMGIWDD